MTSLSASVRTLVLACILGVACAGASIAQQPVPAPAPFPAPVMPAVLPALPPALAGRLVSAAGTPIANRNIAIFDTAEHLTALTSSDSSGRFSVATLPDGSYYITVLDANGIDRVLPIPGVKTRYLTLPANAALGDLPVPDSSMQAAVPTAPRAVVAIPAPTATSLPAFRTYYITDRARNANPQTPGFGTDPNRGCPTGVEAVFSCVFSYGKVVPGGGYAALPGLSDIEDGIDQWFATHPDRPHDIVIFMHGCCTTFAQGIDDAALTSSAITDLPVIFYSFPATPMDVFPSPAHPAIATTYLADETETVWSYPHFAELLHRILVGGVDHVQLIAHSLGNRILFPGLEQFAQEYPLDRFAPDGSRSIGAAVFIAPDIDVPTFQEAALSISGLATTTTVYRSNHDLVIKGSEALHRHPRLGYIDNLGHESVDPSVTVINASTFWCGKNLFDLQNESGHFYWHDTPIVESDIKGILLGEAPRGPDRTYLVRNADPTTTQYSFSVPKHIPDGICNAR